MQILVWLDNSQLILFRAIDLVHGSSFVSFALSRPIRSAGHIRHRQGYTR
jgi:hypothetical protein